MDCWMEWWMNKLLDGGMDEWVDWWINGLLDGWVKGEMSKNHYVDE